MCHFTGIPYLRPRSISLVSFNATSLQVVVQWSPVQYSNGPVTGYKVQVDNSHQHETIIYGASNNTAAITLANLSNSVTVKVSAVNEVGSGSSVNENFSLNGMSYFTNTLYYVYCA